MQAPVPIQMTQSRTVSPILKAKHFEGLTSQLASALDFKADMLRMYGKRRSISVESADVDAGY